MTGHSVVRRCGVEAHPHVNKPCCTGLASRYMQTASIRQCLFISAAQAVGKSSSSHSLDSHTFI